MTNQALASVKELLCYNKRGSSQVPARDHVVFLALEAGHAGPHDLVHQQQVGGDDGAAVDHLPLDSEVEINQSEISVEYWCVA